MRPYEVMVILDPDLEEDAIGSVLDKGTQALVAAGGVVNSLDHWGRRRLAYEIRKKSEGYYVLYEVTAPPTAVAEIDRVLSLADEVMRHKVVRIPDAVAGRARAAASPEPSA